MVYFLLVESSKLLLKMYLSFFSFAKCGVPQGLLLDPFFFFFFIIKVSLGHMVYRHLIYIYFHADDIKSTCPSHVMTL